MTTENHEQATHSSVLFTAEQIAFICAMMRDEIAQWERRNLEETRSRRDLR